VNQGQRNRQSRSRQGRSTLASIAGILLLILIALFGRDQITNNAKDLGQPARVQPADQVEPARESDRRTDSGMPIVVASALPREAQATIRSIERGGPFPYRQDGAIFGNRERLLPIRPNGYYHEYTVPTPGEDDRGARRIVGGETGEFYYTNDHYDSFVKVE